MSSTDFTGRTMKTILGNLFRQIFKPKCHRHIPNIHRQTQTSWTNIDTHNYSSMDVPSKEEDEGKQSDSHVPHRKGGKARPNHGQAEAEENYQHVIVGQDSEDEEDQSRQQAGHKIKTSVGHKHNNIHQSVNRDIAKAQLVKNRET